MKNKKGQLIGVVIGVAIAFVVLALLIPIFTGAQGPAERYVKNTICKVSVAIRSGTIVGGINTVKVLSSEYNLRCPTIERQATQEDVYKIIAEELRSCWDKAGASDADLIESYSVSLSKTQTACLICSQIEPKDKEGKIIIEPQQLKKYLNTYEVDGKKGLLATLIDTQESLEYSYTERQEATRASPITIAYFIYKSNTEPSDTNNLGTEDSQLYQGLLGTGAGAYTAVKGVKLAKFAVTKIGGRAISFAGGGLIGLGIFAGIEGGHAILYKDNTYQGIVIGTGANVVERCDYQL